MNKSRKFEINRKLLIILCLLLVVAIVLFMFRYFNKAKYNSYRIDEGKNYVYTKYSSSTNKAVIPYINIVGDYAKAVNEEIEKISKEYLVSKDVNKTVTYRYNQNRNILSVVLMFRDIDSEKRLIYSFKTYVFDLSKGCKLLTNDEILKMFDITDREVNDVMANVMKSKYSDEIEKGFIVKEECDYKCFLEMRNIDNYIDNANYYIEEGHLVVYRAFSVFSIYGEEEYYTRNDFKFIVK